MLEKEAITRVWYVDVLGMGGLKFVVMKVMFLLLQTVC